MDHKQQWNTRYGASEDLLFGGEPNAFLRSQSAFLRPGMRALAVADGEARNGVWLAERGLDVVSIDVSEVAQGKAERLANARGVTLDLRLVDALEWDWPGEAFDLVVAIFIQFAGPEDRKRLFDGMKQAHALQELELTLAYTLETHIHADHVTSACRLRSITGCKIAYAEMDGLPCADVGVSEVSPLSVGGLTFDAMYTPGHTDSHHSYLVELPGVTRAFTGDALLIDGCGRTDFQGGDAATLYRSIHDKIFTLPGDTLVYPAHDYQHRHVSTVEQERERNQRLGAGKTLDEFIEIMANLNLPYPKRIDIAVPANRLCGDCPDEAEILSEEPDGPSVQG